MHFGKKYDQLNVRNVILTGNNMKIYNNVNITIIKKRKREKEEE